MLNHSIMSINFEQRFEHKDNNNEKQQEQQQQWDTMKAAHLYTNLHKTKLLNRKNPQRKKKKKKENYITIYISMNVSSRE